MPLLYPTYLSGEWNKPPKLNSDLLSAPGMVPQPQPPNLAPSISQATQMPIDINHTFQQDEYGAEMGKEARVWKVYTKETDRADAELVDGWNKSLDVILVFLTVFAALFSAISTAFLIESSQKLQEDPADVTARTLLIISQSLSVLINTTQPVIMEPPSSAIADTFSPSRIMVAVNTLWYLSLSLSVATSLLAMLAKDWCHSFMAGRTGHPYDQTVRRQQKWMLIETWKMQELIMVLPSLIHLSLLLFAVGLCIYVWELNNSVAWPVICVTGASAGFYLWSSIQASIIEYFPYTTVISRFVRSDWLSQVQKRSCIAVVRLISKVLKFNHENNTFHWAESLVDRIRAWYKALDVWADDTEATLPPRIPEISPQDDHTHQDKFVTLALHWLVTTCKTPSAIDAALQAIAGAHARTYREPLEKCGAALEISKRLVTGNIYKPTDQHVVSLYVRALSFLGSKSTQAASTQPNPRTLGDVQVAAWDLQAQYDK
ncbi:hypothetical protein RSOLAG22IIIB_11466 [Rhizoctonia solani]|uniref:DUF6535 domain-containing protein n=1 Tax=Rhizoctonia solani TaxID=456999 RepID=A0A0K6G829_9AGAM|nr:hypothetical protein RSOLAG22IIIB_11466 [Rhizoctonia solani]